MHIFGVALLAATMLSNASFYEPSEDAMREAFAADLSYGVQAALSYVAQTAGDEALARIRAAHTDAFEILSFRKGACRPSEDRPGHVCEFAVEIDTVAGPIVKSTAGRFYVGPCGLAYENDA
jgi:hypothetical protein